MMKNDDIGYSYTEELILALDENLLNLLFTPEKLWFSSGIYRYVGQSKECLMLGWIFGGWDYVED